ncbi:hypothetical protein EYF80_025717 [Liparis tanakae]|uniref:Uncharacterized protein n=1 Tax=Liparis tanakae TaxID=230148 RepID=A0A4Z2HE25_9TELE|nr:hypothetical protein EYF80_025717 [Liparis tanakae]
MPAEPLSQESESGRSKRIATRSRSRRVHVEPGVSGGPSVDAPSSPIPPLAVTLQLKTFSSFDTHEAPGRRQPALLENKDAICAASGRPAARRDASEKEKEKEKEEEEEEEEEEEGGSLFTDGTN